jgi:hypothetical protein
MSNIRSWQRLLDIVQIEGELQPISDSQLDAFEAKNQTKLPWSYREFCKVFGAGSLRARIWIHITTPDNPFIKRPESRGTMESMDVLNEEIWSTIFLDVDEYCPDPALIRQGLFFGSDIYTHHYFWNRQEITDKDRNEMGVWVIYREMKIYRLAESFESFVWDICLDRGIPDHGKLDYDPPIFEAAPNQN